jgi:hypothetical protein
MGCGGRRGMFFEGCDPRRGKDCPRSRCRLSRTGRPGNPGAGNTTNPRIGSGMQQARILRAEETVEVVRNHEDGTRSGASAGPRPGPRQRGPRVDARSGRRLCRRPSDGGEHFEIPGGWPEQRCPGPDDRSGSEGEPKTRGSARTRRARERPAIRRDAIGTPRRPTRRRARPGRERGRPTTRYDAHRAGTTQLKSRAVGQALKVR